MASELKLWRVGQHRSALVFVHGFTGGHDTWSQFINLISGDTSRNSPFGGWAIASFGYPSRLWGGWIPFWSGDPKVDLIAQELQTACESGPLSNFRSYALVAHSMGGLVVQRAVLNDGKLREKTNLIYLYGTPSLGADLSNFATWGQCGDMKPGNAFITKLRSDWNAAFGEKPPFTFRTIAGNLDQFIKPESSLGPFPKVAQAVVPGDHLSMIRCSSLNDSAVSLLAKGLTNSPFDLGPLEAAAVAAEKSDFQEVINLLLPRASVLDDAAKVRLALALEMTEKRDEAIKILAGQDGIASTDLLGALAGQLKRRWLLLHEKADADHALALYTDGYQKSTSANDHAEASYHGINVAFMQLVYLGKREEARKLAREVLGHCAQCADDLWESATVAEAKLILSDTDGALREYQLARQKLQSPRSLLSAYNQARQIAKALSNQTFLPLIDEAFQLPKL